MRSGIPGGIRWDNALHHPHFPTTSMNKLLTTWDGAPLSPEPGFGVKKGDFGLSPSELAPSLLSDDFISAIPGPRWVPEGRQDLNS